MKTQLLIDIFLFYGGEVLVLFKCFRLLMPKPSIGGTMTMNCHSYGHVASIPNQGLRGCNAHFVMQWSWHDGPSGHNIVLLLLA